MGVEADQRLFSQEEEPTQGLYCPQLESDACGTGLIANLSGKPTHELVANALQMLANMEHRGACGCEPTTGDGAGILIQTPHALYVDKCLEAGFSLPAFGDYGVGMIFFPTEKQLREQCRFLLNDHIDELGLELLGYRKVMTDNEEVGPTAQSVEPYIEQVFVKPKQTMEKAALERRLYVLRKYATHNIHDSYPQTSDSFYFTSFSYKTCCLQWPAHYLATQCPTLPTCATSAAPRRLRSFTPASPPIHRLSGSWRNPSA